MSILCITKIIFAASISVLLTACGGGGGSTAPVDYQLGAAVANFVTKSTSKSFLISGLETSGSTTTAAIAGNGVLNYGELAPTTFEGVPAFVKVSSVIGTTTIAGVDTHWSNSGNIYFDINYNYLGTDSYQYATVQSRNVIPRVGHIGDSGLVYTVNTFSSSDKNTLTGSFALGYSLEIDSSSAAILKLTTTSFGISGNVKSKVVENYRILPAGSIDLLSISSVAYSEPPGRTLTYLYSF